MRSYSDIYGSKARSPTRSPTKSSKSPNKSVYTTLLEIDKLNNNNANPVKSPDKSSLRYIDIATNIDSKSPINNTNDSRKPKKPFSESSNAFLHKHIDIHNIVDCIFDMKASNNSHNDQYDDSNVKTHYIVEQIEANNIQNIEAIMQLNINPNLWVCIYVYIYLICSDSNYMSMFVYVYMYIYLLF